MRVALVSVDGRKYPNLALMKIAAYHKRRGDSVSWFLPLFKYDRVYASKVFTFTPDCPYLPPDTIKGGTGYDVRSKLPPDIEKCPPDYSIYPEFTAAYGFLTRGCCNRCPWCVVPKKEGALKVVSDIETVAQGRKNVVLMDNNFLAAPFEYVREQMERAGKLGLRLDFNQATDARLYNERTARIMARVNYLRYMRVSCDTDMQIPAVCNAVELMRGYGYKGEVFCYVLATNEGIESAKYRIAKLTEFDPKIVPFVMPFRSLSDNSIIPNDELKRLARWCNKPWLRKSCRFEDLGKLETHGAGGDLFAALYSEPAPPVG